MDQKGLKLTDELIAALQPQARTAVLWDTEVVNFGVEITPDGAMAFIVELPREGAGRQTLGRPGGVDVQSARQRARALLREAAISRSATRSMTVAEVCDLYLNEALLASKPRVVENAHGVLENHVKPLLGWKPLDALEHADGYRLLKQVSEGRTAAQRRGCRNVVGGPGAANMALRLLSAAVSFAARRGHVRGNPLLGVRKFKQNRPGRPLTHAEYKRLAQAIAASRRFGLESPYALAGVQLLMLTGCRRGEIESLTWDAVDRRRGHLHLRDSKSGDKSVPVGAEVLELLEALPRPAPPSRYVLPAMNKTGHVNLDRAWGRLRKIAELPKLRLHDLRHSFAAVMLSHNETLPTIGKVLGHRSASSTERYTHVAEAAASRAAAAASTEVAAAARSGLSELLAHKPGRSNDAHPPDDADRFRTVLAQAVRLRWLTADQVSVRTGLVPRALAKMRAEGHGPRFSRIGTRVVYSEADIEAWMAERRAAADLEQEHRRRRPEQAKVRRRRSQRQPPSHPPKDAVSEGETGHRPP